MTHLDFVSAKKALPRLASTLNPLSKGFSFIIHQECVRPLAFARGDKKREARDDKKKKGLG
jgi:Ni,Fe-hydrogenase I small subunit